MFNIAHKEKNVSKDLWTFGIIKWAKIIGLKHIPTKTGNIQTRTHQPNTKAAKVLGLQYHFINKTSSILRHGNVKSQL